MSIDFFSTRRFRQLYSRSFPFDWCKHSNATADNVFAFSLSHLLHLAIFLYLSYRILFYVSESTRCDCRSFVQSEKLAEYKSYSLKLCAKRVFVCARCSFYSISNIKSKWILMNVNDAFNIFKLMSLVNNEQRDLKRQSEMKCDFYRSKLSTVCRCFIECRSCRESTMSHKCSWSHRSFLCEF